MARTPPQETASEKARRLQLLRLKRALEEMKRKVEPDCGRLLNPAADALDAYGTALETLHNAQIAMQTLMKTAHGLASESGRSKRKLRTVLSALNKAERKFTRVEPRLYKVMPLYWDALMALAQAYDDRFES